MNIQFTFEAFFNEKKYILDVGTYSYTKNSSNYTMLNTVVSIYVGKYNQETKDIKIIFKGTQVQIYSLTRQFSRSVRVEEFED